MSKILLIYSTTDGHTLEICRHIQKRITDQSHEVKLVDVTEIANTVLNSFDKIVIGASIRYGKHRKEIYDFINKNEHVLNQMPNAFFSVNVVARKPEKNKPDTNPYLIKFLKEISWKPKELGLFAGKIDYPSYRFWDRTMIRLIMWMTKGPTDPKTVIEYTNWEDVNIFADLISEM